MTTQEVASRLVELCRQGQIAEAQHELYADHAVSLEPAGAPMAEVSGKEGIVEKAKHFQGMIEEFHGATISDPVVGGNFFSISWAMDVTMKERGRNMMQEICLYKVEEGKIVSEQFFY